MQNKIKMFLLLMLGVSLNAQYISVDKYISIHPNEEIIMNKFVSLVNHKAEPLSKENKKIKIAMLYPSLQLSDYWRRNKIAFEKRLIESNIDYTIDMIETSSSINPIKQERFISKIIKSKYDFLITTLNSNLEKNLIKNVLVSTNTKVILQNITTPIKNWKLQPLAYVGFDHKIGSLKIADYFLKKFKVGNYAVMFHTQGYVSQMRGDTFIDYMNNNSNLKLYDSYYTQGNEEKARVATLDLLENTKDLKFIYASSTDIAIGVSKALQSLGLKDTILVNGWGGGSKELEMLNTKELDVTVMRINDDAGIVMSEIIKGIILKDKTPKIFSGEMVLIDNDTSKEDIEVLIKKSFRYSDEYNR
ncbi:MAG: substrate-binding domain-containing protein [Campylobacterota bacterium]|nr:substrate-binding domain-containing protein [Campylobacterota bacterium]